MVDPAGEPAVEKQCRVEILDVADAELGRIVYRAPGVVGPVEIAGVVKHAVVEPIVAQQVGRVAGQGHVHVCKDLCTDKFGIPDPHFVDQTVETFTDSRRHRADAVHRHRMDTDLGVHQDAIDEQVQGHVGNIVARRDMGECRAVIGDRRDACGRLHLRTATGVVLGDQLQSAGADGIFRQVQAVVVLARRGLPRQDVAGSADGPAGVRTHPRLDRVRVQREPQALWQSHVVVRRTVDAQGAILGAGRGDGAVVRIAAQADFVEVGFTVTVRVDIARIAAMRFFLGVGQAVTVEVLFAIQDTVGFAVVV